jgi:hypothetical protein
MKNVLDRLWPMYHERNYGRVDERLENPKMVEQLYSEMKKV